MEQYVGLDVSLKETSLCSKRWVCRSSAWMRAISGIGRAINSVRRLIGSSVFGLTLESRDSRVSQTTVFETVGLLRPPKKGRPRSSRSGARPDAWGRELN
jgi:hypothetical protein